MSAVSVGELGQEIEARAGHRLGPLRPSLASGLARELAAQPFDHAWNLAPGLTTPVADPGARQADWTIEAVLERPVRDAFAADVQRDALVLGCGEGRLAHALLDWSASRVVGVEVDELRRRRAELLREHFELKAGALSILDTPSFAALDASSLGTFAAVVVARVPADGGELAATLALARACSRGPVALVVQGAERARAEAAAREAGFERLAGLRPPAEAERRYVLGERAVVLAHLGTPA